MGVSLLKDCRDKFQSLINPVRSVKSGSVAFVLLYYYALHLASNGVYQQTTKHFMDALNGDGAYL